MMQLAVTTWPFTRGLDRRLIGLTLGALALGTTLSSPASAEPLSAQAHYREQPDRGDGFRNPRDARQAQPVIRYEGRYGELRQDHPGSRAYRGQNGHRGRDGYGAQDGYRGRHDHRGRDGDGARDGHRARDGYRGELDHRGHNGYRGRDDDGIRDDHARARPYRLRNGNAVPPSYHFGASDRAFLHHHYRASLRSVRIEHRPYFGPGYTIEPAYRRHVAVLPSHHRRHLPPPPHGYEMGYYEGYGVVYDPLTFTILAVLDLMTR